MSGLPIEADAVNSDPGRFRWLFGLAPYPYPPARLITEAPAAEAEAPAEVAEGESGSEDEAPSGEQPPLEPYTLNSIARPMKDEPAEADAEAGQSIRITPGGPGDVR